MELINKKTEMEKELLALISSWRATLFRDHGVQIESVYVNIENTTAFYNSSDNFALRNVVVKLTV